MKTTFVRGIENYRRRNDRPALVTIGTFDGIHLGHQEIFRRVQAVSQKSNMEPVLATFHPHPRVVVTPGNAPLLLTTIEEKERFFPCFFEGTVVILQFDDRLMNMPPDKFVRDILIDKIGVKKLIVGYDHAFGKNRSGTIPELRRLGQEHGFDVEVVGPVMVDGEAVSSSRIRRAMTADRYPEALRLLGHEYAIYGNVVKGIGLGKKLGYPTANVKYNPRKLLPRHGVYSCRAEIDGEHLTGTMFIGRNHFDPVNHVSVEANLFDFDKEIYGRDMIVYPLHFIRGNRRYDSTEQLVKQIKKDTSKAIALLKREKQDVDNERAQSSNYC